MLYNALLTPLDRKTIKKIAEGTASDASNEKLLVEIGKIAPDVEARIRKRCADLDAAVDRKEITLLQAYLTANSWRELIEGSYATNPHDGGSEIPHALRHGLFALDDASQAMLIAWDATNFQRAADIAKASVIAPYVDWRELEPRLRQSENKEAYYQCAVPLRLTSLLFVFACFEQVFLAELGSDPGKSKFITLLPRERADGQIEKPMPRLLRQLAATYKPESLADLVRYFFGGEGAHDNTEYKKLNRWLDGDAFPSPDSFIDLCRTVSRTKLDRLLPAEKEKDMKVIYFGLKYLDSIGQIFVDNPNLFPGQTMNDFFGNYETIFASLSKRMPPPRRRWHSRQFPYFFASPAIWVPRCPWALS